MPILKSPYLSSNPYRPDQNIALPSGEGDIHDGDTYIDASGRRVRLSGIDAPEMANPNKGTPRRVIARESTEGLANYLQDAGVNVADKGTDLYGRTIGDINNGDASVYQARALNASPKSYGGETQDLRDRLQIAHDMGLAELRNGVSSPTYDAIRAVQVDPNRGIDNSGPVYKSNGLIGNALRRGTDNMQGMLYGGLHAGARAVNEETGLNTGGVQNWAQEGMATNEQESGHFPAKYNTWDDAKGVGGVLGYTAEKIAENLPQQVPMIAGGIAAGMLAPEVAVPLAGRTVLGFLARTVGSKAVGAGAFGANMVSQAGEVEQEQMGLDPSVRAPAREVLGIAAPRAALDVLSAKIGLDGLVGATSAKGIKDVATQLLKASGIGALSEAPTETAQEALAIGLRAAHDPSYDPFGKDSIARLKESAIAGGVVGLGMAGAAKSSGIALRGLADKNIADRQASFQAEQLKAQSKAGIPADATGTLSSAARTGIDLKAEQEIPLPDEAPGGLSDKGADSSTVTPSATKVLEGGAPLTATGEADGLQTKDAVQTGTETEEEVTPPEISGEISSEVSSDENFKRWKEENGIGNDVGDSQQYDDLNPPPSDYGDEIGQDYEGDSSQVKELESDPLSITEDKVDEKDIPQYDDLNPPPADYEDEMGQDYEGEHADAKNIKPRAVSLDPVQANPIVASELEDTTDEWPLQQIASKSNVEDISDLDIIHREMKGLLEETNESTPEGKELAGIVKQLNKTNKDPNRSLDQMVQLLTNQRNRVSLTSTKVRLTKTIERLVSTATLRQALDKRAAVQFDESGQPIPSDTDRKALVDSKGNPILEYDYPEITLSPEEIQARKTQGATSWERPGAVPSSDLKTRIAGLEDLQGTNASQAPGSVRMAGKSDAPVMTGHRYMTANGFEHASQHELKESEYEGSGVVQESKEKALMRLKNWAGTLFSDAEKRSRLVMHELADGRIVLTPSIKSGGKTANMSPEEYMSKNQYVEMVPITNEKGTTYVVHEDSVSGFNEKAVSGNGMTAADVRSYIRKFTSKIHTDKSRNSRITKDMGFANPFGGNNQIDAMAITKLGNRVLGDKTVSSVADVRAAFVRGVEMLMSHGAEFGHVNRALSDPTKEYPTNTTGRTFEKHTRSELALPDTLIVFRSGNKSYTWGDIKHEVDLKAPRLKLLDSLDELRGKASNFLNKSRKDEWDAARSKRAALSLEKSLRTLISNLPEGLYSLIPAESFDIGVSVGEGYEIREELDRIESVRSAYAQVLKHTFKDELSTGVNEDYDPLAPVVTRGKRNVQIKKKGKADVIKEGTGTWGVTSVEHPDTSKVKEGSGEGARASAEQQMMSAMNSQITNQDWNEGNISESEEASRAEASTVDTSERNDRWVGDRSFDPTDTVNQKPQTAPMETRVKDGLVEMLPPAMVGFLRDLAKSLGIKTRFHMVDSHNLGPMLDHLKGVLKSIKNTPENEFRRSLIQEQIDLLPTLTQSAMLYNDASPVMSDREPILFIHLVDESTGEDKSEGRLIGEAAHELGHLIQRVAVDQLIEKARKGDENAKAIVDKLFVNIDWDDPRSAWLGTERFAQMMEKWVSSHKVPTTAIEKFFKGIVDQLRALYNKCKTWFTKDEFAKGQYSSFEKFMEAMLYVQGNSKETQSYVEGTRLKGTNSVEMKYIDFVQDLIGGEFAQHRALSTQKSDYTGDEMLDNMSRNINKAKSWSTGKPLLGTVAKTLEATGNIVGKIGPYVKATGISLRELSPHMVKIAQEFQIMAGESAPLQTFLETIDPVTRAIKQVARQHRTIPEEMRYLYDSKGIHEGLMEVLNLLPSVSGTDFMSSAKRAKAAADYKAVGESLIEYTLKRKAFKDLSSEAKAIAKYFENMRDKFVSDPLYSLVVDFREQYHPLIIDKVVWDQKRTKILQGLMDLGWDGKYAAKWMTDMAEMDGAVDAALDIDDVFAPGMSAKKARGLDLDVQQMLADLGVYSTDLHGIIGTYTHQMVKRATVQSRFGGYLRDPVTGKYIEEEYTDKKTGLKAVDKYGVPRVHKVYHPMAKLKYQIAKMSHLYQTGAKDGVSGEDMKRVQQVYMPALLGTLGSNIDPKLSAIMSWTQLAINMMMLPLSVTSSVVDLGGIGLMSEVQNNPFRAVSDSIKMSKYFTDSKYRSEITQLAKMLGIVNDHAVDSVLSESAALETMTPTAKRINEKFFELIQMKRWTNFSRILATQFAMDSLKTYAAKIKAGDPSGLKSIAELSLSQKELEDWVNQGALIEDVKDFPGIQAAVARWVDMAVLRPDASLRPPIGSDRRAALFWHLKEFMYTFYYVTMKRAWTQMKDQENFAVALPAIALASFSMSLAMAGYGLRKLIAEEMVPRALGLEPSYKTPEGVDAFEEYALRAGLLGPFTILHDMYSADKHGSLALTALMGPAFSKTVEFMDKDLPSFLVHSIPGVAQSATLRRSLQPQIEKIFPKEEKDDY